MRSLHVTRHDDGAATLRQHDAAARRQTPGSECDEVLFRDIIGAAQCAASRRHAGWRVAYVVRAAARGGCSEAFSQIPTSR